jgi:hypothetical protein
MADKDPKVSALRRYVKSKTDKKYESDYANIDPIKKKLLEAELKKHDSRPESENSKVELVDPSESDLISQKYKKADEQREQDHTWHYESEQAKQKRLKENEEKTKKRWSK